MEGGSAGGLLKKSKSCGLFEAPEFKEINLGLLGVLKYQDFPVNDDPPLDGFVNEVACMPIWQPPEELSGFAKNREDYFGYESQKNRKEFEDRLAQHKEIKRKEREERWGQI